MKTIVLAVAAIGLGACAAVDKPATTAANAQAASGTYYCWQDRLYSDASGHSCNWESNVNDACRSSDSRTLSNASIASGPTRTRRCENGQWLVQVTTR